MADPITRLNRALEGRYTIKRELGEGGMATVYLAEDLRHERKVALKVLKPELAAVVGAERFLAEIKTTANLQHPHILPLHDSGEADGFLFYVMPYVQGETLRDRLDHDRQLPVDEAVGIATKLAGALQHAHDHGVIHRDIKPANILLQGGEPVVADFGIALAVGAAGGSRLTETGLSVGTPYYMSPEQATGDQDVGPASDTFALACVLYETLVGEPPYPGSTAQAVLGKIIAGKAVSATEQRSSIPANVDAAVRCALEKLPADRFTSARDFMRALGDEHFRYGATTTVAGAAVAPWKRRTMAGWSLAAFLTLVLGWIATRPQEPGMVVRSSLTLSEDRRLSLSIGLGGTVALSPDGSTVVYRGQRQLWLRRLADPEPLPILGTDGGDSPAISADGATLAFRAGSSLTTVPLQGGSPVTVVPAGLSASATVSWGSDGTLYFGVVGAIQRILPGGEPETVVTAEAGARLGAVEALPENRGLLFSIARLTGPSEIAVIGFEDGEVHTLFPGMAARYATSGHIVYVDAEGTLLGAPFDLSRLDVTGPSIPVPGVGTLFLGITAGGSAPGFALSETGTLLYVSGAGAFGGVPVWVDREGSSRPIDPGWTGDWSFPAISPDGTRLAVDSARGAAHIWVKQLDNGPLTKLTLEGLVNYRASWTPDGRSIVFPSNRGAPELYDMDLYLKRADGSGNAEVILDRERGIADALWSPNGDWLVYRTTNAGSDRIARGAGDILALRPGVDTVPVPLVATPYNDYAPALSPNGRWLVYVSNETGQYEVYVRPFPNAADARWPISTAGGVSPVWANSGRELFYKTLSNELVVVDVQTDPTFTHGDQEVLFSTSQFVFAEIHPQYDVDSDDQRFVMLRLEGGEAGDGEIFLVQNFFEELKEWVGN
jgi:serine/threonine-protein kinase